MKKSKRKNLIQLLFLLSGLGIVFLFYRFQIVPSALKQQNKGKIKLIPNFSPSDVIGLRIIYRDSDDHVYNSLLTNVDNDWKLVSPIAMEADSGKIETLLHDLVKIKSKKIITNPDREQIRSYGFSNPHDRFVFYLKNGRTFSIINGGLATTEKYFYTLQNNNTNRVLIIYAYKFSSAERSTDELADSRTLTLPVDQIKSFEIRALNGKLYRAHLFISNAKPFWRFTEPARFVSTDYPVKKILMKLYTLRFDRFDSYRKTTRTLAGLQKRIEIKSGRQSQVLMIAPFTHTNELKGVASQLPGVLMFNANSLSNILTLDRGDFKNHE